MNEYLYEITRELTDEEYMDIVKKHNKRKEREEREEDEYYVCM